MRVLITGGAGFICSALTRHLLDSGHSVSVLDDFSRGRRSRLPAWGNLDVHEGDVRDPAAVAAAMHGCDSVVHGAYLQGTQSFYANPKEVLDVALRGMLAVLDACAKTGCADLLLISSSEAYQVAAEVPTPETVPLTVPDPLNPRYSYGGGKIACELMALAWQREGILDRAVIARPHNIFGPDGGREHVIPEFCIRMNDQIAGDAPDPIQFRIQGTGQETRSFCYIDDAVGQLALLLAHGETGIYNVGTQDEHSIEDVAHAVAARYGREIKVIPGKLPQGSPPRRLPDLNRIRWLAAGSLAVTPWDTALDRTVAWYRENG